MEIPRVAIAGASGIGRHHAKWHHAAGADVVAFLGTSPDSCRRTTLALKDLFPFHGRGYTDWEELLAAEEPDIVDICAPNELHHDLALAALHAGCHTLCEKPLVWEAGRSGEGLLSRAEEVVRLARRRGLNLGVCTQYAFAVDTYSALCRRVGARGGRMTDFYAEMETLARGRERSPAQIWVDMGPHPLSLLLAWLPDAELDAGSLEISFTSRHARIAGTVAGGHGACRCEMVVRDREGGAPVRRFGINGVLADCTGRTDADGIYRSVLSLGDAEEVGADFMSLLIRDFDDACMRSRRPRISGEVGLRNLHLQISIMREAGLLD